MPERFSLLLAAVRAAATLGDLVGGVVGGPAAAPAPLRHSDPRGECPFPVSGHPYYLAGITIGGPVSDLGSHAGVKAAVRAAGAGTGRDLGEMAHYSAFTGVASRIDRSRFRLGGSLIGPLSSERAITGRDAQRR